jgi:ribosomal subunit interface protein
METNITFRHFNGQHPDLTELAETYLQKINKFYDRIINGDVIFFNETPKKVEIKIHVPDKILIIEETGEELKKILHDATDKMIRQVKKFKETH